jgi:putative membrane protein
MMYWDNGMNGWGFLFMTLSTLVFLGLIVGAIVFTLRQTGSRPHITPPGGDPRQILAERYARGEIDEEEYRRRLDTLRGGQPTGPRA